MTAPAPSATRVAGCRATGGGAPAGRTVLAVVAAAASVLVGVQLVAQVTSHTSPALLALDATTAVVGLALVPVLVQRPLVGGLLLTAMAALSPVAMPLATMAAFHVARWRPAAQAAVVSAAGVTAFLMLGLWRPVPGLAYGWWALLVVVGYAMLAGWGAWAQARRQLVASLAERARRAEAEQTARVAEGRALERELLAREMHDVLAHRLSLLATYAGALEYRPDSSPERIAQAAGVVRAGIHEALQEVREVVGLLRHDGDPDGDGSLRPQPTLLDLPRLVAECRAAGMDVSVEEHVELDAVPVRIGRAAYRVVQEGLTNARRHAPGAPAAVRLAGGPETLEVEPDPGHGLVGVRERVTLLGGTVEHGETAGTFRLRAGFRWTP